MAVVGQGASAQSAAGTDAKIVINEVSKRFGDTQALDPVTLSVATNEFVSLVGPSGCGKSTLLNLISGLDRATSGKIVVSGNEVTGPGRDRGVVFQQATLLPWLTVQKNVEFALRAEKLSARERADRAREFLGLVGLTGFEDKLPAQLSGGMQQRASLARSLSYNPDVLLMDEPFGALDALTRRTMQELLLKVWEQHRITVVMVTHDIPEAVVTSDRVLVMSARPGRIVADVHVDIERPRNLADEEHPEFRRLVREISGMIHQSM